MTPHTICLINHSDHTWLGGAHYVSNIAAALARLPPEKLRGLRLVGITSHAPPTSGPVTWHPAHATPTSLPRRLGTRLVNRAQYVTRIHNPGLHRQLKELGVDFAFPCATGPRLRVGYRSAAWIPDFQTQVRPDFSPPDYRAGAKAYQDAVMRDAQRVVVSSADSRLDAARLYPSDSRKLRVLPFRVASLMSGALDAPEAVELKYNLDKKYFVVCNQFWRNKNHLGLFRAVASLAKAGTRVQVACTGRVSDPRDAAYSDEILQTIATLGIHEHVRLLGAVPRRDMLALMRRAVAVVQPSQFEGWNTGVEEARCLGKRLVLSDIAVHQEQAPPRARFFKADDPEALASALAQTWNEASEEWNPDVEQRAMRDYAVLVDAFAADVLQLATE